MIGIAQSLVTDGQVDIFDFVMLEGAQQVIPWFHLVLDSAIDAAALEQQNAVKD